MTRDSSAIPGEESINPLVVYTTAEVQRMLKVSESTMKRLLKRGLIRANKVGRQYRILGREVLRLVSPIAEKRATASYLRLKNRAVARLNTWR